MIHSLRQADDENVGRCSFKSTSPNRTKRKSPTRGGTNLYPSPTRQKSPQSITSSEERIKQAFQANNYTTLSQIPSKITPQLQTLKPSNSPTSLYPFLKSNKVSPTKKKGCFSEFEYIPERTPADDAKRLHDLWTKLDTEPFRTRNVTPAHVSAESFYPYQENGSPTKKHARRNIEVAPFVPPGTPSSSIIAGCNILKPNRAQLKEIVKELHQFLINDWPEQEVSIKIVNGDLIQVGFGIELGEEENRNQKVNNYQLSFLPYMNYFSNNNYAVNKYMLIRVTEAWNIVGDDSCHIIYTFKPSWVHRRSSHPLQDRSPPRLPKSSKDNFYSYFVPKIKQVVLDCPIRHEDKLNSTVFLRVMWIPPFKVIYKMEYTKSSYVGDTVNERMEGYGCFTFGDSGSKYTGEMKDGMFHGEGVLVFPNGSQLKGTWDMGRLVDKQLLFTDGLKFNENTEDWDYCRSKEDIGEERSSQKEDRRFYDEILLSDDIKNNKPVVNDVEKNKFTSLSQSGIRLAYPHQKQSQNNNSSNYEN
ncbi:hypothetical protein AKO1_007637 [Acrasis kona]|uniref:MORN repeat-containing protein 5 n=1 Tax=Acrasis kona TaxID=1008807 RepID=A0AAW2YQP4_9EUKA